MYYEEPELAEIKPVARNSNIDAFKFKVGLKYQADVTIHHAVDYEQQKDNETPPLHFQIGKSLHHDLTEENRLTLLRALMPRDQNQRTALIIDLMKDESYEHFEKADEQFGEDEIETVA